MSLAALMTYEVEVLRRTTGAEDPYGGHAETFTSSGTVAAWVEQLTTDEESNQRSTTTADVLVILPQGTVVEAYDRLLYEGKTLEIVGHPLGAAHPAGPQQVEFEARWIEG